MASEFQIIMQLDALAQKVEIQSRLLREARQRVKDLETDNAILNKRLLAFESLEKEPKELKAVPKKPAESPKPFLNPKEMVKIVSDNPTSTVSNAELKQKLDEYIQEIDRCIAHLNNLS